ncbi:hypothetical protein SCA6_005794 [Theobroma cacao]
MVRHSTFSMKHLMIYLGSEPIDNCTVLLAVHLSKDSAFVRLWQRKKIDIREPAPASLDWPGICRPIGPIYIALVDWDGRWLNEFGPLISAGMRVALHVLTLFP